MSATSGGRALVLGGGMGGLLAARVLADHFRQVTVLERDLIDPETRFRPGTPQGWHFHGLLSGGLLVLSELFPGITDELCAMGAQVPQPEQFYFYLRQGKSYATGFFLPQPFPPLPGVPRTHVQTRGTLERCVRSRVAALPNVEIRYGVRVRGLVAQAGAVKGVQLDHDEVVDGVLVVDALGRNSKTPKWLAELGYQGPREEVVGCDTAYSTLFTRPRAEAVFEDVGFFVLPDSQCEHPRRAGALVRMEDDSWLFSVVGRLGDYPPTELPEFHRYAETLHQKRLAALLAQADPTSDIVHYRFRKSLRRRYDELLSFPAGLLPIGDAICRYNPLYGQGMTVAIRQARLLGTLLRDTGAAPSPTLWKTFLSEAYQETRVPWLLATLVDLRDPLCKGDFPSEELPLLGSLAELQKGVMAGDAQAMQTIQELVMLTKRLDELTLPA